MPIHADLGYAHLCQSYSRYKVALIVNTSLNKCTRWSNKKSAPSNLHFTCKNKHWHFICTPILM